MRKESNGRHWCEKRQNGEIKHHGKWFMVGQFAEQSVYIQQCANHWSLVDGLRHFEMQDVLARRRSKPGVNTRTKIEAKTKAKSGAVGVWKKIGLGCCERRTYQRKTFTIRVWICRSSANSNVEQRKKWEDQAKGIDLAELKRATVKMMMSPQRIR